jgi:DNA-binding beta-propeller fold protein YncE
MVLRDRLLDRLHVALMLFVGLALVGVESARGAGVSYTLRMEPLPVAGTSPIYMDFIAFDPATRFVWVPAGNTGTVVVIDTSSETMKQIPDLPTAEMGSGERKRVVGPSSVTTGDGWVYVGNRADSTVCAFESHTLARGTCQRLDSMPDGLAYVAATREVWVTTPRDKSVRILDAVTTAEKAKLSFDGSPEGFAVDASRGRFYTNLEDEDRTLAIDLKTHKTVATWYPKCGKGGPHGLRIDADAGHLFVACSSSAEVLDAAHDGAILSSIDAGDGVDDIDYSPATHLLYVGAAKAGQLTIARDHSNGKLSLEAKVPTIVGARNPAVTDKGVVYLAHSASGGLRDLVVATPKTVP